MTRKTSNLVEMWPDRPIVLLVALAATCSSGAAVAEDQAPQAAAARVVESLHDALLEASANPDFSLAQRYEMLEPAVRDSHDLDYIARFILRRRWAGLTARQQRDFRERFEELSITSYASRFTGLSAGALATTAAEALRHDRVQVDAELTADDGRVVTLSYTLNGGNGDWRIINVIADGVSDLALRRSEYSRVLTEDGFEALLDYIDGQIADLR